MQWGKSIGEHTAAVVKYFLASGKAPEQGYKACAGMTKLAERYGEKRLERARERLLAFTTAPSIRTLNTILKNGIILKGASGSGKTLPAYALGNAASPEERRQTWRWVRQGHGLSENPWFLYEESGWTMDFISAMRMIDELMELMMH